mmetsp:Transcript_28729/g.39698  ORF Transcript_28729/g.39698 Transcript_28729/m.39698 type:complete len:456 (-) Transcript_28729:109-1476(-)
MGTDDGPFHRSYDRKKSSMMRPISIVVGILTIVVVLYMMLEQNGQSHTPMVEVSHSSRAVAQEEEVKSLPINHEKIQQSCTPKATGPDAKVILVTGAGGFVGFHTAMALHRRGDGVLGYDNFNEYYPSTLKRDRQAQLELAGVHVVDADLIDEAVMSEVFSICRFTHVLHLAAQAGVRYAVKNPQAYVHSNLAGFVTLLEVIRHQKQKSVPGAGALKEEELDMIKQKARDTPGVPVLVYASSSSVYGLNTKVPFSETDRVDRPASLYAATKKSNEMMAHTYNNIYGISTTGLRFFTVYGPYGRPDMAYFSFTNAIMAGKPIKIFQGPGGSELGRDFTFIDDIVAGCVAALDRAPPSTPGVRNTVYNLGNTHPVNVSDFVGILETHLGKEAKREYVPMPETGDVLMTHADVSKAMDELGYRPSTSLTVGLEKFVKWYKSYYKGGTLHKDQLNYKPA